MADRYLVLADTILRGINDREFGNASLKDKAIAAAIFTDKAVQLQRLGLETGLRQAKGEQSIDEETQNAPMGAGLETL